MQSSPARQGTLTETAITALDTVAWATLHGAMLGAPADVEDQDARRLPVALLHSRQLRGQV